MSGGTWGTAEEVPGSGTLNTGGTAQLPSVSCASAGNCSAGGSYTDGSGRSQAFVVNETNGTWGTAKEVAATLNRGSAQINSVSCASAGNCSAGGFYNDASGHPQAFVVNETNGTWGTAKEVAATLNRGGDGWVSSVSCASAGNCSAGGAYSDRANHFQAFVANETNGTWRAAEEVAAALNTDDARLSSVSCVSAGNCSAGGFYGQPTPGQPTEFSHAFVINETNGTWGTAEEVAAALDTGRQGAVSSVSCWSAGNCSASGIYSVASSEAFETFVINETNGTWGTAEEIPGIAALNQKGAANVSSLSCEPTGTCSAGGFYTDANINQQVFVVNKT
ncbi:MAG TPA: hypothetical protein VGS19_04405 [Streptosporangiaceae bacterium]|nr:hypothetical protein [Streptosporangiaceae bacterium]